MTNPTQNLRGPRRAFVWRTALLALLAIVALVLAACQSGTSATPTKAPAGTTAPSGGGQTVGQLADQGKTVYAQSCAACHGDQGQGGSAPAIMGSNAKLAPRFKNAKEVDAFVRANMPQGAPGSLKPEQYNQVVAYMMQQNNVLKAADQFNDQTLTAATNLPK
ncbi:MAG: c-type cytochrome [Chloroflexota bacterium]